MTHKKFIGTLEFGHMDQDMEADFVNMLIRFANDHSTTVNGLIEFEEKKDNDEIQTVS